MTRAAAGLHVALPHGAGFPMSSRQRILLTGASSGFGALTARALARAGHDVYAGMRDLAGRGALPGAELTGWAEREGLSVTVVELDVTDDASVDAAVAAVLARAGGIDVLVNNAGVAAAGLVETFSVAAAQRLFDVNVFGVLRLLRAVLPGMRARGAGLVVYVSSTDGREVMPFLGLYNATKFAVEALADAYRYETDPLGIDSVVVQPGTFPTTRILPNLLPADDPDRAQGYGPVAEGPAQLLVGIEAMIAAGAPDPQLVADAIVGVVATPARARPTRVVVDASGFDGAARLNALSDTVQAELLARFGLSFLAGRQPARGA